MRWLRTTLRPLCRTTLRSASKCASMTSGPSLGAVSGHGDSRKGKRCASVGGLAGHTDERPVRGTPVMLVAIVARAVLEPRSHRAMPRLQPLDLEGDGRAHALGDGARSAKKVADRTIP